MIKVKLTLVVLTVCTLLNGQPLELKKFLNSEFIHQYDSIQRRAVKSVLDFKAIQHLYDQEQQQSVQNAYNASANLFNNTLQSVKRDLLDREKRKFIRRYPEEFSKIMMADLYLAKDFYQDYYMMTVTEVTEGRITGFAWLVAVTEIYQLGKKAWGYFKMVNDKWKNFNEEILQTHLIEKHRFPLWEEIQ